MKKISKIALMLSILSIGALTTSAQVIVRVRPARPVVHVVKRPPAPAANYVWVDEEWVPRGNSYVWHGGYWVAPPRRGARFVAGHWRTTRRGSAWIPGRWR